VADGKFVIFDKIMRYLPILAIIISSAFFSCGKNRYLNAISQNAIYFGSSGGFAGLTTEYQLSGDGNLRLYNSLSSDTSLIKKLDKKELGNTFKKADLLDSIKLNLSETGNMTYYIRYFRKEGMPLTWSWVDGNELPQSISQFYQHLNQLTIINNDQ
jgi:hypothetical protein